MKVFYIIRSALLVGCWSSCLELFGVWPSLNVCALKPDKCEYIEYMYVKLNQEGVDVFCSFNIGAPGL